MASYYYLIASLPELRADGEMPITYGEFLALCRGNVSDPKYELLEKLTLSSTEGPLLKEWAAFYGKLMRELNFQRSTALGRSYTPPEEKDILTSQVVAGALAARNPLESEKILLAYEFENLDEIMGLHVFDDYVLFGYAVKLKLLERLTSFDREKGREEFTSLFSGIQRRVYSL